MSNSWMSFHGEFQSSVDLLKQFGSFKSFLKPCSSDETSDNYCFILSMTKVELYLFDEGLMLYILSKHSITKPINQHGRSHENSVLQYTQEHNLIQKAYRGNMHFFHLKREGGQQKGRLNLFYFQRSVSWDKVFIFIYKQTVKHFMRVIVYQFFPIIIIIMAMTAQRF